MPEIVITVSSDGSTRVETRGFAAAACQQASRFLEEALGARINEHLTAEFFAVSAVRNQQSQSH